MDDFGVQAEVFADEGEDFGERGEAVRVGLEFLVDGVVDFLEGRAGGKGGLVGDRVDKGAQDAAEDGASRVRDATGGGGLLMDDLGLQFDARVHRAGETIEPFDRVAQLGAWEFDGERSVGRFGGGGGEGNGRGFGLGQGALGVAGGGFGEFHAELGQAGELRDVGRDALGVGGGGWVAGGRLGQGAPWEML